MHAHPVPPVACSLASQPELLADRIDEFRRLFAEALISRERTADGIRFRLRSEPAIETWVRDLAQREHACCPFFQFDIAVGDAEIYWYATVIDDDSARQVLDELYQLAGL